VIQSSIALQLQPASPFSFACSVCGVPSYACMIMCMVLLIHASPNHHSHDLPLLSLPRYPQPCVPCALCLERITSGIACCPMVHVHCAHLCTAPHTWHGLLPRGACALRPHVHCTPHALLSCSARRRTTQLTAECEEDVEDDGECVSGLWRDRGHKRGVLWGVRFRVWRLARSSRRQRTGWARHRRVIGFELFTDERGAQAGHRKGRGTGSACKRQGLR